MYRWGICIALAGVALGAGTPLHANTLFVNGNSSGWFGNNGQHTTGNSNYEIGDTETAGFVLRDFATFTLPTQSQVGVGQGVISATLTITNATTSTSDPSETASFFDVTTPAATLNSGFSSGSTTGQAIYDDLGTGTIYGSQAYTPSDPAGGTKTIALDSSAVAAINAALGSSFAIGGAVTSLDAVDNIEVIYAGSNGPAHTLALTTGPVPEPGGAGLMALGALFGLRRVRNGA